MSDAEEAREYRRLLKSEISRLREENKVLRHKIAMLEEEVRDWHTAARIVVCMANKKEPKFWHWPKFWKRGLQRSL